MACGYARREAYTAGGEATLWSLEILNVDAFVLIISGAAPPHLQGLQARLLRQHGRDRLAVGRQR